MIYSLLVNIQTIWVIRLTELFIRGKKLNTSLIFITRSYFAAPKNIRLNSTHHFVMKISNKIELPQIAFNHLSDLTFKTVRFFIKS